LATLALQLADHALLHLETGRLVEQQTFGEILLVKGLEDVLGVGKTKERDDPLHEHSNFVIVDAGRL